MLNNQQNFFPTLDLGEYILREKQASDVRDFFNYYTDPEVNKYIISHIPKTLEETRMELNYWKNIFYQNDGIYFAIARKDTNQLIGTIGVNTHIRHHRRIELSYDLSKDYWRLGITTKAIKAVTEYCFEEMAINRIEAFIHPQNINSIKLLEKCKFKQEGLLRQHRFHIDRYVDVFIYSLLKNDHRL